MNAWIIGWDRTALPFDQNFLLLFFFSPIFGVGSVIQI